MNADDLKRLTDALSEPCDCRDVKRYDPRAVCHGCYEIKHALNLCCRAHAGDLLNDLCEEATT